jgi:hypothetical protein
MFNVTSQIFNLIFQNFGLKLALMKKWYVQRFVERNTDKSYVTLKKSAGMRTCTRKCVRVKQLLMQYPPNGHVRNIKLFPHRSRTDTCIYISIGDILSTCYKCTTLAINHKLNVSGHMSIRTFFLGLVCGTHAKRLYVSVPLCMLSLLNSFVLQF